MRTLFPILLALAGCSATIAGKVEGNSDTGATDGSDGTDGSLDSGDVESEPEPDFSVWSGSRTFSVEAAYDEYDCQGDEISESGIQLTDGAAHSAIMDLCPQCTYVYEIEVASEVACDWIELATTGWRGITLGEDWAQVYRFEENGGRMEVEELDLAADWDGWNMSYEYLAAEEWWGSITVDGQLAFEEL